MSWAELSLGTLVQDPPHLPSFCMYGHLHYLPFNSVKWTIALQIHLCPDPHNQSYTIFNLHATRLIVDNQGDAVTDSEDEGISLVHTHRLHCFTTHTDIKTLT
jgi:hypothetical protein